MAVYTVHEPPRKQDSLRAERFRFVRDGFYFWAFLVPPLWLLWHRLWLSLVGYLALMVALAAGMYAAGMPGSAMFSVGLLVSILVGLEAGTLRRWTLRRRGWHNLGIVSADDLEAAERRFFDSWTGQDAPGLAPPSRASASLSSPGRRSTGADPEIVGLFPEPGASR